MQKGCKEELTFIERGDDNPFPVGHVHHLLKKGNYAQVAQRVSAGTLVRPPFPVGRVHRLLKKGNYAQRVSAGTPVRLLFSVGRVPHHPTLPVPVITRSNALSLVTNAAARDNKKQCIVPRHPTLPVITRCNTLFLVTNTTCDNKKQHIVPCHPTLPVVTRSNALSPVTNTAACDNMKQCIVPRHLQLAICNDEE